VKVTLGPKGRNVVLERLTGAPIITNDGVTIAREIELSDPFKNMGAMLVRQVASKTSELTGEGTTTATVLAQALVRRGMETIEKGAAPDAPAPGDRGGDRARSRPPAGAGHRIETEDELRHVATIAAKEDERIGAAVAEALYRVGAEGVVSIEESASPGISVHFTEGMLVENGVVSPYMIADQGRMETVLEDPYILMTTKPISSVHDLMPALDALMKAPRPLVVLAEKIDGQALGMLIQNSAHGTLQAIALRAPGFGHRRIAHLQDLAAFTGGQVITDEVGLTLKHVKPESFGRCRRVIATEESATFVEGAGDEERVGHRIAQIRVDVERGVQERDREIAAERLAKLSSRLAVIRVGGATDVELKERIMRTEGALAATRAAVSEGVVAGGGSACCAPSGPSRTTASRATTRSARKSCDGCSACRCTGSRLTPATTARRRSTRFARWTTPRGSTR